MESLAEADNTAAGPRVTVRQINAADTEACARICFEAFGAIHDHHRFPRDFPTLEMARDMIEALISDPSIWGVAAEVDGRVVGSNFLHEGDPIAGIGPIAVDPEHRHGVGRRLMEAAIERGKQAPGIRLVQDAFNMRSLALYESLGFDVKEPLAVVGGKPSSGPAQDMEVRPLRESDLDACEALCARSSASSARMSFAARSARWLRGLECAADRSSPISRIPPTGSATTGSPGTTTT